MRHLTSHCIFLDGIRLWQASASLALNRAGRSRVGSVVPAEVPGAMDVSLSTDLVSLL